MWSGGADAAIRKANAGRRGRRVTASAAITLPRVGNATVASVIRPPAEERRHSNVYRPVVSDLVWENSQVIQRVNNHTRSDSAVAVDRRASHWHLRHSAARACKPSQQQRVSLAVTGFPERPWLIETDLRTHLEQQLSRPPVGGQPVSQVVLSIR